MRTAQVYRAFFKDALTKVREQRAAYDAEVAEWFETGDGAAPDWQTDITEDGEVYRYNAGGRGYAFPHCIHGASRWTDYDNICGGCEDSLTDLQEASMRAREAWVRFCTRWDWFHAAPGDLQHQQPEAYDAIREWVFRSFPGYTK